MEFYTRYQAWHKALYGLVDTLSPLRIQADWDHIISKQAEIEDWFDITDKYDFWSEFEQFVFNNNDKVKIEVFFYTVENSFLSLLDRWERVYKFYDSDDFKDWYYPLAKKEFNADTELAYKIYMQLNKFDNTLTGFLNQFEKIKLLYTELPPRKKKLFYEIISGRVSDFDIDLPSYQFNFIDWYTGGMDELLIRIYLQRGKNIQPLIWPGRWESFNQKLKENYHHKSGLNEDGTLPEYLVNFIIDRIIHHDGNLSVLFKHQINFYPPLQQQKIVDEMLVIHTQIVSDNWHHKKKGIDIAIQNSIDPPKLIAYTIHILNDYFDGKTTELIYPLSKPSRVSQQAVTEAYQDLLRGQREVDYVRPTEKHRALQMKMI